MFYCLDCGSTFEEPKEIRDIVVTDPFPTGPIIGICPICKSTEILEMPKCDECGEDLLPENVIELVSKQDDNTLFVCESCADTIITERMLEE